MLRAGGHVSSPPASPFDLDGDLVPCVIEEVCSLLVCDVFGLSAADASDDVALVQRPVRRRPDQHLEEEETLADTHLPRLTLVFQV